MADLDHDAIEARRRAGDRYLQPGKRTSEDFPQTADEAEALWRVVAEDVPALVKRVRELEAQRNAALAACESMAYHARDIAEAHQGGNGATDYANGIQETVEAVHRALGVEAGDDRG